MKAGKRGDGLPDSDEILVQKIKTGNPGSFEILVSRYQRKIFAFIYRMVVSEEDARDLTQEVFIQVFRALDRFRGDAKFSTWLYRIAANKSLDFLRRTKSGKIADHSGWAEAADLAKLPCAPEDNPEHIYLQQEKIRRVRRLIAGLPDRYRVVLVLFHYENLTYRQIADALDIPVKTVATRLYRAKLLLKENLGGEPDGMP